VPVQGFAARSLPITAPVWGALPGSKPTSPGGAPPGKRAPRSKGGKETDISNIRIYPGFKSPHTMLLSYEEKGKCSVVRRGAEFPSIGDQPEAKANQRWPVQLATPRLPVEARVAIKPGWVITVGMVAKALRCDRGRPVVVLWPEIIKRPGRGIPGEGSRGITVRENRSKATTGVGWTHSSDEGRADEMQNLRLQKTAGGDCKRGKAGPAKGSWSGTSGSRRTE